MKKVFKLYAICWGILLATFNVICFVASNQVLEMNKYDGAFWAGYAFITLAFVGQLICAFVAFKETNINKFFYKLPLLLVSYTGLVLTIVFGGICMVVPNVPNWVGIIICFIILAFTAIAVVKACAAGELVTNIDEKVKEKTSFIKSLTVDVESVLARAKSEAVKEECKKVYEAVRYSDPISNEALSTIEAKITVKVDELSSSVSIDDAEKVKEIADEIVILVADRNKKCKALKQG